MIGSIQSFLRLAAICISFFAAAPSVLVADEISLERQFDCMIQSTYRGTVLTVARGRGHDIQFSEIEAVNTFITTVASDFGQRVSSLPEREIEIWVSRLKFEHVADEIVVFVKDLGYDQALTVTKQRYEECYALLSAVLQGN